MATEKKTSINESGVWFIASIVAFILAVWSYDAFPIPEKFAIIGLILFIIALLSSFDGIVLLLLAVIVYILNEGETYFNRNLYHGWIDEE